MSIIILTPPPPPPPGSGGREADPTIDGGLKQQPYDEARALIDEAEAGGYRVRIVKDE